MAELRIYVDTWGCVCGYAQDFDPSDSEKWLRHIVGDRRLMTIGIEKNIDAPTQGKCPACWLGINDERTVVDRDLAGIVDLSAKSITSVKDPEALASEVKEVRQYNAEGEAEIVEVPLTKQERETKLSAINQALDTLSTQDVTEVAAEEVTP